MRRRTLSTSLIILLLGTMLMACSSGGGNAGETNKGEGAAGTNPSGTTEAEAATYPIQTDKKLTYWGEINGNLIGVKNSHSEIPFFQKWQEKTGVPLEFTAPPTGQVRESLNVMLASGDLPDMIEYNFIGDFPGGRKKQLMTVTSSS